MNKITINGVTIEGRDITVAGRRIVVDGRTIDGIDTSSGTLDINVSGDLVSLTCEGSVKLLTGDVRGSVSAGGSVSCHDIGGNANAGGSIKAMHLSGNANAGGSIKINQG